VVKEIVEGTPVEKIVEKVVTVTPVPPTEVPPTQEPKAVDTAIFGLMQEPDSLHPLLGSMTAKFFVQNMLFPQCMSQNEKAEWLPLGCETVPSLDNGGAVIVGDGDEKHLEVTYKIRKGWRWTDGTPVTSKDVIYWWKLSMDPEFEIAGRTVIEKVYDIKVVDDSTVTVIYMTNKQIQQAVAGTLTGNVNFAALQADYQAAYTADWPYFAADPVFWYNIGWLPEHILSMIPAGEQSTSDYARMPVGDGPYVLKEWNPGQELILVASDLPFPLGEPKLKTVIFRLFGDGAGVKAALSNGEIDAALGNPAGLTEEDGPDLDAIEAAGLYKVDWVNGYSFEHIDLNVTKFPLDDVRVRQALYYAIDRKALSDTIYYGKKVINDVPLPKGLSWAYPADSDISIYNFDLDKAKGLLADAGWDCSAMPCTKEVDGEQRKLEFTLMTTDRKDRQKLAQAVQAMWKKLNVGVNLQFLYGRGLFQVCSAGGPLYCRTFDAAIYTFGTDDSATFYNLYSCAAIPSEVNNWSGQNSPGWCNQVAVDALNQSENNPDIAVSQTKRLPYIFAFFKELTKEVPVVFLYGSAEPFPHRTGWKNFKPGPTQYSLPTWNSWEWELMK